ncbi:MAG: hypothetical protein JKY94_17860 [Rhodobacteraceae bacterium]|nr:hypothetical protein [Paracoccaceae bacterium]
MTAYIGQKQGSVQTSYADQPLPGFPGQLATTADPHLIDGYPTQELINVGLGVVQGDAITETAGEFFSADAPYKVQGVQDDSILADFVGILVRGAGVTNDVNGVASYDDEEIASVMRKGRIYVSNPVAISSGDPVWMFIDNATAHNNPIGSFTNADPGSGDAIQITTAVWYKRALANTVAVIELGYKGAS